MYGKTLFVLELSGILPEFTRIYWNYTGIPVLKMAEFSCKKFKNEVPAGTESEPEVPAILELPASRNVKPRSKNIAQ